MNQRRPAAEIMNGLTTKSDKIRALAQAGYDRTEINKVLDIRSQHVRNVLLQSGITGGLRRDAEAEREPIEVDAAPATAARTHRGRCSLKPSFSSSANGPRTRRVKSNLMPRRPPCLASPQRERVYH